MRPMGDTLAHTTGRLDRLISEMKTHAQRLETRHELYDEADAQTLKHHAEDMIAMGNYILAKVEVARNGIPQG